MKTKIETITSGPDQLEDAAALARVEAKAQDLYQYAVNEFGHSPEMVEAYKALKVFTYWAGQAAQDA